MLEATVVAPAPATAKVNRRKQQQQQQQQQQNDQNAVYIALDPAKSLEQGVSVLTLDSALHTQKVHNTSREPFLVLDPAKCAEPGISVLTLDPALFHSLPPVVEEKSIVRTRMGTANTDIPAGLCWI